MVAPVIPGMFRRFGMSCEVNDILGHIRDSAALRRGEINRLLGITIDFSLGVTEELLLSAHRI